MKCRCAKVGSSQHKFHDVITFKVTEDGTDIELKIGSVTENSSRPFHVDRDYIITRVTGIAMKFEIIEL